jgi:quercetin dioxygenase-like cupin family protein
MDAKRYFVSPDEVPGYSPANHSGTVNKRLVSHDTVGAKGIEIILGVASRGNGAHAHFHPGIEQVVYMLEGSARAEVDGQSRELGPGEVVYFPAGMTHVFTATTETVKCLVIYTPPYGEDPNKGVAA